MQQSDLDGIKRDGALARSRGECFHANPHYCKPAPWATTAQVIEWHTVASAWASGWLKEDGGRDQMLARLTHVPLW